MKRKIIAVLTVIVLLASPTLLFAADTKLPTPVLSERTDTDEKSVPMQSNEKPLLPLAPTATDKQDYTITITSSYKTSTDVIFNLELNALNGKFIGPDEVADFDVISVVSKEGKIFRQTDGKYSHWYGVHFVNATRSNVTKLNTVIVLPLSDFKDFESGYLAFQGLSIYKVTHENIQWNVSDYLRKNPDLNKQKVKLVPEYIIDDVQYYEEPKLESRNLGIELVENIDFTLENIFIQDKVLFIRADSTTLSDYAYAAKQGNEHLSAVNNWVHIGYDKLYSCRGFNIIPGAGDVVIDFIMYNKYFDYQNYRWLLPITKDFSKDATEKTTTINMKIPGTPLTIQNLVINKNTLTLSYSTSNSEHYKSVYSICVLDKDGGDFNGVSSNDVGVQTLTTYLIIKPEDKAEFITVDYLDYKTGKNVLFVISGLQNEKPILKKFANSTDLYNEIRKNNAAINN